MAVFDSTVIMFMIRPESEVTHALGIWISKIGEWINYQNKYLSTCP